MKRLTAKQLAFVDAYIANGGNGSEAARQAGYSAKGANVTAAKLLAITNISQEIAKRLKELESMRTATVQDALEYISDVLRGNENVYEEIPMVVGNGRAAKVQTVKRSPLAKDRLKAAELIMKFSQKSESEKVTEIKIIRAGASNTE